MKAVISNFRMSRTRQYDNQMIIIVDSVKTKEDASKFIGKSVVWQTPGKNEIKGQVKSAHGNSGAVRVLFEKGMPGQAVGTQVKIV